MSSIGVFYLQEISTLVKWSILFIQKIRGLINERELLVKMQTSEKQVLSELKVQNSKASVNLIIACLSYFSGDIKSIENGIKQIIDAEVDIQKDKDIHN